MKSQRYCTISSGPKYKLLESHKEVKEIKGQETDSKKEWPKTSQI